MDKRCSLFCPTASVEEKQCLITLKPDQTSTPENPGVQDMKLFSSPVIPWKTKLECVSVEGSLIFSSKEGSYPIPSGPLQY